MDSTQFSFNKSFDGGVTVITGHKRSPAGTAAHKGKAKGTSMEGRWTNTIPIVSGSPTNKQEAMKLPLVNLSSHM